MLQQGHESGLLNLSPLSNEFTQSPPSQIALDSSCAFVGSCLTPGTPSTCSFRDYARISPFAIMLAYRNPTNSWHRLFLLMWGQMLDPRHSLQAPNVAAVERNVRAEEIHDHGLCATREDRE